MAKDTKDDKQENEEVVEETSADTADNNLEDQIAALTQALAEAKNKQLRTMADFENYRRRIDAEKSKFGLMTNRMLVDSILDVLDDVQMAQGDEGMDLERAKELFGTFTDKLVATLRVNGVERIEINKGDDFDSSIMEAITTIPGEADNKVVDVISGAYKYANKEELLKTAKVVVSKKQ